jgi:hypothetical protein
VSVSVCVYIYVCVLCMCVCVCVYIYIPKKKTACNNERYEQNKEDILKYRRERYRHKKDLNIKVSTGTFTLYFD